MRWGKEGAPHGAFAWGGDPRFHKLNGGLELNRVALPDGADKKRALGEKIIGRLRGAGEEGIRAQVYDELKALSASTRHVNGRFTASLSRGAVLTRVAAIFLLAMMALTSRRRLRSGFNAPSRHLWIIELFLAATAFLAIPEVFLRDQHITIELIDQVVPESVVRWLKLIGTFVALVFVGLLAWHMTLPAREFVEFNDVAIDLHLPLIWKASLVLAAFAFAVAAVLVMFLREVSSVLRRAE